MRFAGWLIARADRRWGLSPRPEDDDWFDCPGSCHASTTRSTSVALAPPPANGKEHHQTDDDDVDHVLEGLDRRLDFRVVLPDDETGIDEGGVPRQRSERAGQEEATHRHAADPGRVADERPDERHHSPEEDSPGAPSVEPSVSAIEIRLTDTDVAAVSVEQRSTAPCTDVI